MKSVEVPSYSMYTYLGRYIPIRQPNIIPVGKVLCDESFKMIYGAKEAQKIFITLCLAGGRLQKLYQTV